MQKTGSNQKMLSNMKTITMTGTFCTFYENCCFYLVKFCLETSCALIFIGQSSLSSLLVQCLLSVEILFYSSSQTVATWQVLQWCSIFFGQLTGVFLLNLPIKMRELGRQSCSSSKLTFLQLTAPPLSHWKLLKRCQQKIKSFDGWPELDPLDYKCTFG